MWKTLNDVTLDILVKIGINKLKVNITYLGYNY